MKYTPVGVDIAKHVIQIHFINEHTGEVVDKQLRRQDFLTFFGNREPCLIGMEACGGSQHWARELTKLGHKVRLLQARFVKAFVMGNKNDVMDARAIWMAVQQPGKEIAVKTEEQQSVLVLHRTRMQLVKFRTAQINALHGTLWGLNLSRHAHIRQSAVNRLWGWAVIAQFSYYLAGFPWYEGNILFAFAVAAQVLTWCETRSGWRTAAAILLMALWGPLSGTSYGIAGLLMLAVSHRLYRAEDRAERLALVACLLAVIPALNLATSDAAAVAGLVMTVLTVGLVSCAGKSLPRFWPGDFFPVFYACHLAVLGVLAL
ncbi:type-F conjugative transfer system pilin acetylase TraX [Escherichia coli]